MSNMTKRAFIAATGGVAAIGMLHGSAASDENPADGAARPDDTLQPMTGGAKPITTAERAARRQRAARIMQREGIGSLIMEAGSTLTYFTGIRWWRSERFTGAVLTSNGDLAVITPFFEAPSIREQLAFDADVRTWHEDESPFALVSDYLTAQRLLTKPVAIEGTTRFFVVDGIRRAAPDITPGNGDVVTRGCRMYKSPAELTLMQVANDVTMAAYRYVYPRVREGMAPAEISNMMNDATRALGGSPEFSAVLLNEASAFPHGSDQPQTVREGGVILMDCGCSVHDYESDISRSWVFGDPTDRQREVWQTVRAGQQLALETARPGVAAGVVDRTVRDFYTKSGYGPDYRTPGLTHRLGHGIGMDGHEPINFVRGERMPLAPGMCFSNEPGIYIPGEFGIRLEDCLYITDDGPVLFSSLSPGIDTPFG